MWLYIALGCNCIYAVAPDMIAQQCSLFFSILFRSVLLLVDAFVGHIPSWAIHRPGFEVQ